MPPGCSPAGTGDGARPFRPRGAVWGSAWRALWCPASHAIKRGTAVGCKGERTRGQAAAPQAGAVWTSNSPEIAVRIVGLGSLRATPHTGARPRRNPTTCAPGMDMEVATLDGHGADVREPRFREDSQELREHDPEQAGHGTPGTGGRVPGRTARTRPRIAVPCAPGLLVDPGADCSPRLARHEFTQS